ncbi:MAG: hypothetical protein KF850_14740 [Labilithrix sp.]|nr:hypothetical protein [Labilithrix sp.]
MTRIRDDIESRTKGRIRARVRAGIPAFTLATAALGASAAAVVACGDAEPRVFDDPPPDAAVDVVDPSLPPVDDAGADEDIDADAARPVYDASDEPVVCATTPCVKQLTAGDRHFCALMSDGTVQCWGTDTRGSLGRGEPDGGVAPGAAPQPVVDITNATQVSVGQRSNTSCARDADGQVWCWGENSGAQLGLEASTFVRDNNPHPTPSRVALTVPVVRVDVGQGTACAIADDGAVHCWGGNADMQLARPELINFYGGVGLALLGDHDVTRTIHARYSSFAITKDGRLLNWGRPSGRQSSLPSSDGVPTPVPLPGLADVTQVAISGTDGSNGHQCAIAGGRVHCWGSNIRGELGNGVPDSQLVPGFAGIIADSGVFPQQLALGAQRTCVRMTDGTVQCCGDDRLGALGRGGDAGTFASRIGPASALDDYVVQIVSSAHATCALIQGGKVTCWGGNANGELGQGTTDSDPHPTPVTVVFP